MALLTGARSEDAEAIAALHIASWRATYAKEIPEDYLNSQDPAARAAHWRRNLDSGTKVLLMKEGSDVTGFVACGPAQGALASAGEWEIYNLHVIPHRKGEGMGSRLFDAAADRGQASGARSLVLWVVRTNAAARAFYERKGMKLDGGEQVTPLGPGVQLDQVRYRSTFKRR